MSTTEKKRKILVTNALPYANGAIHLGHLVGYIQADIWVRFQKMRGHQCTYICGSDAHGTPIMIKAQQMGITPEDLVADMHKEHAKDFAAFNIEFDNFYTTHSDENRELSEDIFNKLQKRGDISKKTIAQAYDPKKEMFLPDRYVTGECPKCGAADQYGDSCEACGATYAPTDLKNPVSTLSGATPIEKESEHYFFDLQNYATQLKAWTHSGHLQPQIEHKLDEWFEAGLRAWDISRDAPYFGFKIPGEENKFFYVWLDAPIGYMASFKNLCAKRKDLDFAEYWQKDEGTELYHFIGKDIVYFHSLFWPAMLSGADYRTPTAIYANGFLTVNGKKMSKSRGTFITANQFLQHFNPECLRYYFAAKLNSHVEDLDLNFDDFASRVNSDLVGKVVNIASRCCRFINNNFDDHLAAHNSEQALYDEFVLAGEKIANLYQQRELSRAMREISALADRVNQYIDEKKPWTLIKQEDQEKNVHEICSVGLNLYRVIMTYLKPVLPELAQQTEKLLHIAPMTWDNRDQALLHHKIAKFEPLLQRIDKKQISALQSMLEQPTAKPPQIKDKKKVKQVSSTINIEDFAKVDLRVARVIEAEAVPDADKLVRLRIDLGNEDIRQVFAGIKSSYQPEQLLNKLVVAVANLAPRKMRFGTSEAMLLVASSSDAGLWLVSPEQGAKPGDKVK